MNNKNLAFLALITTIFLFNGGIASATETDFADSTLDVLLERLFQSGQILQGGSILEV